MVNATIPKGIYHGDAIVFSTITKFIYGFSDKAITASSDPIGMQINIAINALNQ